MVLSSLAAAHLNPVTEETDATAKLSCVYKSNQILYPPLSVEAEELSGAELLQILQQLGSFFVVSGTSRLHTTLRPASRRERKPAHRSVGVKRRTLWHLPESF